MSYVLSPSLLTTLMTVPHRSYDAIKRELPTDADLEETDAIIVSGSFEDGKSVPRPVFRRVPAADPERSALCRC